MWVTLFAYVWNDINSVVNALRKSCTDSDTLLQIMQKLLAAAEGISNKDLKYELWMI